MKAIKWLCWPKLKTRTNAMSRYHAVVSEHPTKTACGLVLPDRMDYLVSPEPAPRCKACDTEER